MSRSRTGRPALALAVGEVLAEVGVVVDHAGGHRLARRALARRRGGAACGHGRRGEAARRLRPRGAAASADGAGGGAARPRSAALAASARRGRAGASSGSQRARAGRSAPWLPPPPPGTSRIAGSALAVGGRRRARSAARRVGRRLRCLPDRRPAAVAGCRAWAAGSRRCGTAPQQRHRAATAARRSAGRRRHVIGFSVGGCGASRSIRESPR